MKITEPRLKEIIREELSEQKYNSNIVKFFKSLYRPGDDRRRRILQRLGAKPEEEPEEPVPDEEAPEAPSTAPPPAPEEQPPVYKYKISDDFNTKYAKILYGSWKSKRKNKPKEEQIFIQDLNIFVNFVAPYLPSYYIKEAFRIEKMFDRGEFVDRKGEMEKAWKKVSSENQQAINRIYTATQAKKGQKNKILFHILKNITNKSDK